MTSLLFDLCFYLVAPFWALMILAPGWRWTRRIVSSPWIAIGPVLVYLVVALPRLGEFLAGVASPSLAGVQALLGGAAGAAAGWAHLLAFDLFVGRWIYLDSRQRGLHPVPMAPIMLLTILLGPVGFAVYLGLRAATGRNGHAATESAVAAH